MKNIRRGLMFSTILIASIVFAAGQSFAQMGGASNSAPAQSTDKPGTPQAAATPAPAAKIDPQEEADYKAFYDLKPENTDQRITLGEAFVQAA